MSTKLFFLFDVGLRTFDIRQEKCLSGQGPLDIRTEETSSGGKITFLYHNL